MKKIVFLGCENSHAGQFLSFIKANPKYSDIEVLGVHSDDEAAKKGLAEKYGVKALDCCSECKDEADGVIITARHGDLHLKLAAANLKEGITMFIDKPVTIKEEEAVKLIRLVREKNIKLVGGSSLKKDKFIEELAEQSKTNAEGGTIGGYVRAPVSFDNPHGGFYFYSQHLVDMVLSVFGSFPKSVLAKKNGTNVYIDFYYENYQVCGHYTEGVYSYYAMRQSTNGANGALISLSGNDCFEKEFDEFYEVLSGKDAPLSDKEFISPVFVLNAIDRSLKSGKEEKINEIEL